MVATVKLVKVQIMAAQVKAQPQESLESQVATFTQVAAVVLLAVGLAVPVAAAQVVPAEHQQAETGKTALQIQAVAAALAEARAAPALSSSAMLANHYWRAIMIIVEQSGIREHRYSDLGFKLRQIETNILYDDAYDKIPCKYTYEETDIPIEQEPMDPQEALDMIFGGTA